MIVLDASATVDGFFRDDCRPKLARLIAAEQIVVPQHFDAECVSGLRRLDMKNALSTAHSRAFFQFLESLPFVRVPTLAIADTIWKLRKNMTVYDASYVAIAQSQGSVLVTHDDKLARAAQDIVVTQRLAPSAP